MCLFRCLHSIQAKLAQLHKTGTASIPSRRSWLFILHDFEQHRLIRGGAAGVVIPTVHRVSQFVELHIAVRSPTTLASLYSNHDHTSSSVIP
jgi:hypothetical protein